MGGRGSTARATPRRARPPVADVRVTRLDGTVEIVTTAAWKRRARAERTAPATDAPYPLESFLAGPGRSRTSESGPSSC